MGKNINRNGMSKHPIYKCWYQMNRRCYSKKDSSYERYGGAKVTVCDEWKDNFDAFYEWAKDKWSHGLTIDKDILCNKLGISPKVYSPKTCQFVTPRENGMASSHTVISDKLATEIEKYMKSCHNLIGLRDSVAKKFSITKKQLATFLSSPRCKFKSKRGSTKKAYPELEEYIFKLKSERYTYKQIELKTGINWSTCRSIVNRLNKQGYKV